jgi:lambda repressor-like predicted transcriptional regulator
MKRVKTISVADIAREAGIRPETARARLRRRFEDEESEGLPEPVAEGIWVFSARDKRKVERLIADARH